MFRGHFRTFIVLSGAACAMPAPAADIALLTFCTAPPPANAELAAWHASTCPQVLADAARANALALQAAEQTAAGTALIQEQGALTAKLAAEKAAIDNLRAVLPAAITTAKPDAVDVKPLAHLAQYRQAVLLREATAKVARALKPHLTRSTLLVNKAQLDELTRTAVDPEVVTQEFEAMEGLIGAWCKACPAAGPPKHVPLYQNQQFHSIPPAAVPLVVESIAGAAGRIATMFQTSLVGAAEANLAGEQETLIWAAFIEAAGDSLSSLRTAVPMLQPENAVLRALKNLRAETTRLAADMALFDEKDPCNKGAKSLLDAIAKRMEALNAPTPAGISPLAAALRRASFDADETKIEQFLLLTAEHKSGSIAAVKRGLLSANYVQSATATLSYRLQTKDGAVVTAGVELGSLDIAEYDKRLKPVR